MIFCDTSLLLSLYVQDRWSKKATALVNEHRQPLAWTAWHQLELMAASKARAGRGLASRVEVTRIRARLQLHRQSGFLRQVAPDSWHEVFEGGWQLACDHGARFLNRGMDILHVSLCLTLGIHTFWTMDARQHQLAQETGLTVNPLK